MSRSDELQSDRPEGAQKASSESLLRFDLTGNKVRKWSVAARDKLVATLRRLCDFSKKTSKKKMPGTSESVGEKVKTIPGKLVEYIEHILEKGPIEDQLKAEQTKTQYLDQELKRAQVAKIQAETQSQKLDNLKKEIEIQERLQELIEGRTDILFHSHGDRRIVFVGNLPADQTLQEALGLTRMIDDLGLSKRVLKSLEQANILAVSELASKRKRDLLAIKGIGESAVKEIESALDTCGLSLTEY